MIIPAILEKSTQTVKNKLQLLSTLTDYVQIDILKNWPKAEDTLAVSDLSFLKKTKYKFELHLMVKRPILQLSVCQKMGASLVYGQIENMDSQQDFVKNCHKNNLKAGLALDLPSFLNKLDKQAVMRSDAILIMAVEAGSQGKSFNKKVLGKLKRLVRIKKDYARDFSISIDGGINKQNAKHCISSGADNLCIGSSLLNASDINTAWNDFNNL